MVRLANMTIPLGTQVSNEIDVTGIDHLSIYGPGVLTGTIAAEISPDKGTTWYPSGAVPAVNVRVNLDEVHGDRMRLTSDMVEVADRIFSVQGSTLNVV
jgi:hypothetical protein